MSDDSRPRIRPAKPSKTFPLFPHGSGQWAKKILGKTRYFGVWVDPEAALRCYLAQAEDLHAGRPPRALQPSGLTLKALCNDFLTVKRAAVDAGELEERTWQEYLAACRRLCASLGKDSMVTSLIPADFERLRAEYGKTWGPVRVGNEIQRVRGVFRHALRQGFLDRAVIFGEGFKKPSRTTLRKHRAAQGVRMFEAAQIRKLLEQAGPTMRAMILLAINCALGNHDVAALHGARLDLRRRWLDYPRPKTGIDRRCPLWPETIAALRKVLRRQKRLSAASSQRSAESVTANDTNAKTPSPKTSSAISREMASKTRGLVFVTRSGRSWLPSKSGNPISMEFLRVARRAGVWRKGLGFYALRHTFSTIGEEVKDRSALEYIMGHAAEARDMTSVYRERIGDDRLQAVAEHVRGWLWPDEGNPKS